MAKEIELVVKCVLSIKVDSSAYPYNASDEEIIQIEKEALDRHGALFFEYMNIDEVDFFVERDDE